MKITNDTHWRTEDICTLIQTCIDFSDENPVKVKVEVVYNEYRSKPRKKGAKTRLVQRSNIEFELSEVDRTPLFVKLKLPRNGPRELHDVPMVAIAAASAAPTDGTLLAPSETFKLANELVFHLSSYDHGRDNNLSDHWNSNLAPTWAPVEKFLICKVDDPMQDATYLAFVKKKTTALKRAKSDVKREEKALRDAQRRLKKAQDRIKAIEKSLADAEARRS